MPRRPVLFIAVGTAAAVVHSLVAVSSVAWLGIAPLVANVIGWLCAFGVSFRGHHGLTFGDRKAPARRAVGRFFLISASGFAVNETAYALCLYYTPFRYDVLLAAILLAVAVLTYLLSHFWAFVGSDPASTAPRR